MIPTKRKRYSIEYRHATDLTQSFIGEGVYTGETDKESETDRELYAFCVDQGDPRTTLFAAEDILYEV